MPNASKCTILSENFWKITGMGHNPLPRRGRDTPPELPASGHTVAVSTENVVLIMYKDIVRVVDRGQLVPLVLLDLSSAFETVDHDCLLSVSQHRFSVDGDTMTGF